jgi:hypothetical protein
MRDASASTMRDASASTKRLRLAPLVAPAIALAVASVALPARADEAACIAATEESLTLRKQGKLHDALKRLAICAEASCSSEVKAECTQRIDAIDAAMPTLVLGAKDGAGNDLYDVRVSMDGAPLTNSLDGRPVAIDPGEHDFTFETAGTAPVEKKLVLREGEKERHESVTLGSPPPTPAPAPTPMALPPPAPAPSTWSTQKKLAVVSGGVGVLGLGLGAWFGVFAASSQSREKRDCPAAGCTNQPQAVEDYNTAKENAVGSTIAFVAGGALVAAGAVLWFTAPVDRRPGDAARLRVAPVIDARGSRLIVGGAF